MHFKIHNNFDLARVLGSRAFDSLAKALSVFEELRKQGLSEPAKHRWQDCLDHSMRIRSLRQHELMFCFDSVILFQASMEKIPILVQEGGGTFQKFDQNLLNKGFKTQWKALIDQLPHTEKNLADSYFSDYETIIYKGMRNPIVHGRDAKDLELVDKIRVTDVHSGIRSGWAAYDCLLTHLFANGPHAHEPSWATICSGSGVPADLDLDDYPDLNELISKHIKRYQDGCKQAEAFQSTAT